MKPYASLFFLLTLVFSVTSAGKDAPIETGFFNNDAIYGYDPVAYFTDNHPVKGNDKYQTQWRGATWSFTSEEHKALFDSDPAKYAPQYGGHCAYALANGDLAGIDEEAFSIVDGKLYLNYSKRVKVDWQKDQAAYIQKADRLYPQLVNLKVP